MMLYRLANKAYINDTTGIGAQRFPGRWNPKGTPCLYTSVHLSLSLLEKFVHARATEDMQDLHLLTVDIKSEPLLYRTDLTKLKTDWIRDISYTQWLGHQILEDPSILGFVVPSAIVPTERNVILNPLSVHFGQLSIPPAQPYAIDDRLLLKIAPINPKA